VNSDLKKSWSEKRAFSVHRKRCCVVASLTLVVAAGPLAGIALARDRPSNDLPLRAVLVEASPSLAPFQHVRFCLRYPAECKSDPSEDDSIHLTRENLELLGRVNHAVNAAIVPVAKHYGANLGDRWTIAPSAGDCNDYAVTKRHELIHSGLPAKALRLAVVRTASEVGHLVLLVSTTRGDLVLDNLTEAVRPWQTTDYHWLKIQSARDSKFWYDLKVATALPSPANRRLRVAQRQ
jgi:predicted transglutaminase-like cysteine proteinase